MDGCQIVIVMQLVSQVVAFNLMQPDFFETSARFGSMLGTPMQKGPSDQLYVAMENEEGSSIIFQITYVEKKELKYKEIYRSVSAPIVAF